MDAVARYEGFRAVFLPALDEAEAALVDGIEVYGVGHFNQLIAHLRGDDVIVPISTKVNELADDAISLNGAGINPGRDTDLADVRGQEHAKRAPEVAASGGHNLLRSRTTPSGLSNSRETIAPRMSCIFQGHLAFDNSLIDHHLITRPKEVALFL